MSNRTTRGHRVVRDLFDDQFWFEYIGTDTFVVANGFVGHGNLKSVWRNRARVCLI